MSISIKVSELAILNEITNDDYIIINDSASVTTKRATFDTLSTWMTASNCNSASYALTASYAKSASYAISASYALTSSYAISSSYTITSSYSLNARSASYALTASNALTSSNAITASYVISSSYSLSSSYSRNSTTASYIVSSSYALTSSNSISASYARSASYALTSSNSISSSYSYSSSYAITSSYSLLAENANHATVADSVTGGSAKRELRRVVFDYDMYKDLSSGRMLYSFPISNIKSSNAADQLPVVIYMTGGGGGAFTILPAIHRLGMTAADDKLSPGYYSPYSNTILAGGGGGATVKLVLTATEVQAMDSAKYLYLTIGEGGLSNTQMYPFGYQSNMQYKFPEIRYKQNSYTVNYLTYTTDFNNGSAGGNTYIQIDSAGVANPVGAELNGAVAGGGSGNSSNGTVAGVGGTATIVSGNSTGSNGQSGGNYFPLGVHAWTKINYIKYHQYGHGGNAGGITTNYTPQGNEYEYIGGVGGVTPSIPGGGGTTVYTSAEFYDINCLKVGTKLANDYDSTAYYYNVNYGDGAPGRIIIEYYPV